MAAHLHKHPDRFRSSHPENIQRRKIISIVTLLLIMILFSMIAYFVGRPLVIQFRTAPESFRDYVKSQGIWGPVLMIGLMALQVIVAVIPGGPIELAAGFVCGWFQGTLWCLIGSLAASTLVFLAVRKWGVKLVELFFSREKILNFSFLQNEKKLDLLVFVLFLIPGSPKDLLTYLVGLTHMKLHTFLLLSTLARAPSVIASTVTGSLAQNENYVAALILFAVTLVISLICVLYYRRISRQEKEQEPHA